MRLILRSRNMYICKCSLQHARHFCSRRSYHNLAAVDSQWNFPEPTPLGSTSLRYMQALTHVICLAPLSNWQYRSRSLSMPWQPCSSKHLPEPWPTRYPSLPNRNHPPLPRHLRPHPSSYPQTQWPYPFRCHVSDCDRRGNRHYQYDHRLREWCLSEHYRWSGNWDPRFWLHRRYCHGVISNSRMKRVTEEKNTHPSITWRGFIDIWLVDNEKDLYCNELAFASLHVCMHAQ